MTARGSYVLQEKLVDLSFEIEVKIKEPLITVRVYDWYTGIRAQGSAKRNDPDRFDVDTGRTIALARALGRFARRLERQTIRELDSE